MKTLLTMSPSMRPQRLGGASLEIYCYEDDDFEEEEEDFEEEEDEFEDDEEDEEDYEYEEDEFL